jgi:hypothetical protein
MDEAILHLVNMNFFMCYRTTIQQFSGLLFQSLEEKFYFSSKFSFLGNAMTQFSFSHSRNWMTDWFIKFSVEIHLNGLKTSMAS